MVEDKVTRRSAERKGTEWRTQDAVVRWEYLRKDGGSSCEWPRNGPTGPYFVERKKKRE
jgi:hypothetical protein